MMNTIGLALISLISFAPISGHMEVRSPPPRNSRFNKKTLTENINYSLKSPVTKYGCSQFAKTDSVETYKAGENIQFSFSGTATHNGGSCQFGLSYDGNNFISLLDVMGDCLIGSNSYNMPIPKDAPNGQAIAGWFWINKTGNREFYMNCIDITIEGGSENKQLSGRSISIANLDGYPTIPEGDSGIEKTKDLYKGAKTISISKGSGSDSYPTKVETQVVSPKEGQSKPVAHHTDESNTNDETVNTPSSSPSPSYSTSAVSPQTHSKPNSEPMKCEHGKIMCEDDSTIISCVHDKVFRVFCKPNTKCVINTQVANCL